MYNSIWKWPSSSPITTSPCWFLFLVLIVMAIDDILHTSHPLLHSNVAHANNKEEEKNINFVSLAKWVLKFTMWIVFLAWVALFFVIPTDFGSELYADWIGATNESLFGYTGSYLLIQPRCRIQRAWLKTVHFQGVICCYTVAQLSLLLFLLFHIFSSLGKTNYNYKSMYFFNLCTPFTCFHFVFTIYDS